MAVMYRRKPFSQMSPEVEEKGAGDAEERALAGGWSRRARELARRAEGQLAARPVAAAGVACLAGFVAGALVGSRLARALLLAGASFSLGRLVGPGRVIDLGLLVNRWVDSFVADLDGSRSRESS
jgi:hypothetical protein